MGLVAIIVSIIEAAGPASRQVQFGVRTFLIILSVSITVNTMFIGKATSIHGKKKMTSSGTTDSGISKMRTTNEEEMTTRVDWEKQCEKLKKEKKKLRKEVKALQEALDALKQPLP